MIETPLAEWLERANRLAIVARLLSNTVHDVNDTLQVISGNAELLDSAPAGEDNVRRRSLTIRSHASRASALLAELTAFARDASDRPQRVTLKSLVGRAIALRQYSLGKYRISTNVEGDEGVAVGVPRDLLLILLNLFTNAEEALVGQSEGLITIRITSQGDTVVLSFTDNGPGCSAEAEKKLFRADLRPGDPQAGLGIGLNVSKWLAEQQGGTLEYQRVDAGGCIFRLTLPAHTEGT